LQAAFPINGQAKMVYLKKQQQKTGLPSIVLYRKNGNVQEATKKIYAHIFHIHLIIAFYNKLHRNRRLIHIKAKLNVKALYCIQRHVSKMFISECSNP
jgi:endonuclease V-like protein UPF0215 family